MNEAAGITNTASMCSRLNAAISLHIDADKKLLLYSLRANVRTGVMSKTVSDNVQKILAGDLTASANIESILDEIMGHSSLGSIGRTVYNKYPVVVKAEVLKLLTYPVDTFRLKQLLT